MNLGGVLPMDSAKPTLGFLGRGGSQVFSGMIRLH